MELRQLAETVLFSRSLADKLRGCDLNSLSDLSPGSAIAIPSAPVRPAGLAAEFRPKQERPESRPAALDASIERGRMLHSFANHELLAAELMALAILRFTDAPQAFRLGVARTLLDELRHLQAYLSRMRQLGVELGEIPLSGYFWRSMSSAATPMDFVTRMSLTFEQANLDFARHYANAVQQMGDTETHQLLVTVYEDEIRHVAHGLHWFREWKGGADESDWDAYRRSLPFPLTPARAKGSIFDEEGRRRAGLSDEYIQQLRVFHSSKGRTPALWIFNPDAEQEWLTQEDTTDSRAEKPAWLQELKGDLEPLLMFVAKRDDIILTSQPPRPDFLQRIYQLGIAPVEFQPLTKDIWPELLRQRPIRQVIPWAWTNTIRKHQDALEQLKQHSECDSAVIKQVNSKAFACRVFCDYLTVHAGEPEFQGIDARLAPKAHTNFGELEADVTYRLQCGQEVLVKPNFGSNGRGQLRCRRPDEWPKLRTRVERLLAGGMPLIVEPWFEKIADISALVNVSDSNVQILAVHPFFTSPTGQYWGSLISRGEGQGLAQLFHSDRRSVAMAMYHAIRQAAAFAGSALQAQGYQGPAAIDNLVIRNNDAAHAHLKIRPILEINARYSMGRVAHELLRLVPAGHIGLWFCLTEKLSQLADNVSLNALIESLAVRDDVVLTSDSKMMKRFATGLALGRNLTDVRVKFPFLDRLLPPTFK